MKYKAGIRYPFLLALLLMATTLRSQTVDDKLLHQKFNLYNLAKPSAALFLHTDKAIYTNNEKIWFSAYLLNTYKPYKEHRILYIALINNTNHQVALTDKFVISDAKSINSLTLPDTILPGRYRLHAYTDLVNGQSVPLISFTKLINIKVITEPQFKTKLTLLNSGNGGVSVKVNVEGFDKKLNTSPQITYRVGQNQAKSLTYNMSETVISIPEKDINNDDAELWVTVKYEQQVQYRSLRLPKPLRRKVKVQFFPEGGQLAAGLLSTVAFETRTAWGHPIALTGWLMQNNQVIAEVKSNAYGDGIFKLTPDLKSKYILKIPAGSYLDRDTVLDLPTPNRADFTLHLAKAVINDTLSVTFFTVKSQTIKILMHNHQGAYMLLEARLTAPSRTLKIPLNNFSEGLAMLTVIDSVGKPLAERAFFAHHDQLIVPSILTQKAVYNKKDSVKLKVHLTQNDKTPVNAVLSVAAVRTSRLSGNEQQLADYFYFNRHLHNALLHPTGQNIHQPEYLEHLLLTKGWRRYAWPDIMQTTAADTLNKYTSLTAKGSVTRNGKPLKKPVQVVAVGGKKPIVFTTATDGAFLLDPLLLMANGRKKILLKVAGSQKGYEIKLSDPATAVNNHLSAEPAAATNALSNNTEIADNEDLELLSNIVQLQAVEVKALQANSGFSKGRGEPGPNACGDYASYNGLHAYLNYERTEVKDRVKPVAGRWYFKRIDLEGSYFKVVPVFYDGCTAEQEKKEGLLVNGVYETSEQYTLTPEDTGLLNYSTLYWGAGLKTDKNGDIELKFAAGELSGDYQIMLEGVAANGSPISGKTLFVVK